MSHKGQKYYRWPDRLFAYSDRSGGPDACWPWLATRNTRGYGVVTGPIGRRIISAHRAFYEFTIGPIPDGMQIDHLCRNPACVNPRHLEVVTWDENQRRSRYSETGRCRKGHDTTQPGALMPAGRNRMRCRACREAYMKVWKARRAA